MTNIQQELAALRARIDELEAQAKAEEAKWPKLGDAYFYVECNGEIGESDWECDDVDAGSLALGNVYRTKEDAEREVERRKVLTQLRKLAKASGAFDLVKPTQSKYRIVYDAQYRNWVVEINHLARTQGAVYFATEQAAKAAIETIGADRLMLLLED